VSAAPLAGASSARMAELGTYAWQVWLPPGASVDGRSVIFFMGGEKRETFLSGGSNGPGGSGMLGHLSLPSPNSFPVKVHVDGKQRECAPVAC